MMDDWDNTAKRFGIACFENRDPSEPEGYGDSAEFCNTIDEAKSIIGSILKSGRFQYLVLWDGVSGYWEWVDHFYAGQPKNTKAEPSQEIKIMALELIVADMVATVCKSTTDPISSLETKRKKFDWFFETNKADIVDAVLHQFQREEIRETVNQVFLMAEVLIRKQELS